MLSTKKCSHNLKESYFIWWERLGFWARETETTYQLLLFSCSVVSNSLWPHGPQRARFPCPLPLPELAQTHVHWVSDVIQPSHLLSSRYPPAFNLSQHQELYKWVNSLHQWSKYWSFTFSISLSNEYLGLTSLRMDWLYLLAVQGTLKSRLQYHSSKASMLWCSAFYTPTLTSIHDHWKNHSLN